MVAKRTQYLFACSMTLLALGPPAVAQVRPVRPQTVVTAKPVTVLKPLTPAQLAPLSKPAPRFLNPAELRGKVPPSVIPNLKSAFELTPAVQEVAGRGKLVIEGDLLVPKPTPPGFSGQAIIRRGKKFGSATEFGSVKLTFTAQQNQFYVVDCLVMANGTGVNFYVNGESANPSGKMQATTGHMLFNIRKTDATGTVSITMHPDLLTQTPTPGTETVYDINVMHFWGCKISTG